MTKDDFKPNWTYRSKHRKRKTSPANQSSAWPIKKEAVKPANRMPSILVTDYFLVKNLPIKGSEAGSEAHIRTFRFAPPVCYGFH